MMLYMCSVTALMNIERKFYDSTGMCLTAHLNQWSWVVWPTPQCHSGTWYVMLNMRGLGMICVSNYCTETTTFALSMTPSNCAMRKFLDLFQHLQGNTSDLFQNLIFELWNLRVYPAAASIMTRYTTRNSYFGRVKRIWYLSPMRAAKVQASLRIRAVLPEPPLLAHTSSESRGTFGQKARSLALEYVRSCRINVIFSSI